MARVAIVVVTHNSAAEIGGCLDALARVADAEVIVVDNASSDPTTDLVRQRGVRLIANARNAGFAAAVNMGVRATAAPFVLLLNPDAHLVSGLEALLARFDDPRAGVAGGLLLGEDGRPQSGFMARNLPTPATLIFEVLGINRLWPRNPVNWHYRCKASEFLLPATLSSVTMSATRVEQPAGAFLMFPRAVWNQLDGFDERFRPVWFEDVDFCTRVRQAGWEGWFEPRAVARHTGAHSIRSLSLEKREQYWYGSLLEYAAKHYHPVTFRVVCLAVAAGAVFRALGIGAHLNRKAIAVYGDVLGLALSRFFRQRKNGLGRGAGQV
jgi:N-acetylglucosaminyl-diphospho-decaprenol L-rhamnosyltransferase